MSLDALSWRVAADLIWWQQSETLNIASPNTSPMEMSRFNIDDDLSSESSSDLDSPAARLFKPTALRSLVTFVSCAKVPAEFSSVVGLRWRSAAPHTSRSVRRCLSLDFRPCCRYW
ncbi:hypothetical protein FISHEDRAFT_73713 [Fistulina hepatica ATCC 64428]|uniref:Uncharacterized protein n=1 Tax=Fistulina hepatica ATCC 64428 TaxID=1128425 RepID=A0A0D7ADA4_9AGAR|nr:hypothetical protein FISHEDRAFT_73713 [Fistulina hepatica ATCC 64428]